jgi:hypothetical protein
MKLKTKKTFITRARTKKIKIKRTRTEVESPITKRTKLYLWKRREREKGLLATNCLPLPTYAASI